MVASCLRRWRLCRSKAQKALASIGCWTIEIVKRSDAAKGFKLLPRRWVVERTIAWVNRNRRLTKDFEATIASAETWLMIASVKTALTQTRQSMINPGNIMSRTLRQFITIPNQMARSATGPKLIL